MNLRFIYSDFAKWTFYSQFCDIEEHSLKINMNARGYTKEASDDVTLLNKKVSQSAPLSPTERVVQK